MNKGSCPFHSTRSCLFPVLACEAIQTSPQKNPYLLLSEIGKCAVKNSTLNLRHSDICYSGTKQDIKIDRIAIV